MYFLPFLLEFSMASWMDNFGGFKNISSLPVYAYDILYNDMGIAGFLSQSQCVVGLQPFTDRGRINNGIYDL
jgi:hypothetical protein